MGTYGQHEGLTRRGPLRCVTVHLRDDFDCQSHAYRASSTGTCCAYNAMPLAEDVISPPNPNYWCFKWQGAGKPQMEEVKLPGTAAIPFPPICPHNLNNCYSIDYYTSNGRVGVWLNGIAGTQQMEHPLNLAPFLSLSQMAKWMTQMPTQKGLWIPPKNAAGEFMWCGE